MVSAQVTSSNANLCKVAGGAYSTWIMVPRFTDTNLKHAITTVQAMAVWHEMVEAHLTSTGDVPVLDMERFKSAPRDIVDALAFPIPDNISSCMRVGCADCPDLEQGWCKHVAAVCYHPVTTCESTPLSYLRGIGVDLPFMLSQQRKVL